VLPGHHGRASLEVAHGLLSVLSHLIAKNEESLELLVPPIEASLVAGTEVGDDVVGLLLQVGHAAGLPVAHGGEGGGGVSSGGGGSGGCGRLVQVGCHARGGQAGGLLLGYGAIRGVFSLDVEEVAPLGQVDGGGHGLLAAVLDDIPLAEADGGVFVPVG